MNMKRWIQLNKKIAASYFAQGFLVTLGLLIKKDLVLI